MSSDIIAKLILEASRIVMMQRLDALHPNNFGYITIVGNGGACKVSLEEIGSAPGEFNVTLKVEPVPSGDIADGPGQTLAIDGPFGMLEYTEVLFLDEQSGELCRRSDSFLVTSQFGETSIKVDLNAIGTFVVQRVGAENPVDA